MIAVAVLKVEIEIAEIHVAAEIAEVVIAEHVNVALVEMILLANAVHLHLHQVEREDQVVVDTVNQAVSARVVVVEVARDQEDVNSNPLGK